MPTEEELLKQVKRLCGELDKRVGRHKLLEPYFEVRDGQLPIPDTITHAKLTKVYKQLLGMSQVPWGKPVVNAKLDRLEVTGIQSGDRRIDDLLWRDGWQLNAMDLESKLGHSAALLDGRCHALVWPYPRGHRHAGKPQITLDDVTQMVVQYAEGSRRERVAALRRFIDDDDRECVTLYRPEALYKFRKKKEPDSAGEWEHRDEPDGTWPLPNPYGVVPVTEVAVNRRLASGSFTHARGEFEDVVGLMDRINLLTFLGLVVALFMGFPLRVVIGTKILYDDDGNPIAPFDAHADEQAVLENPAAKIQEFSAADRKNLSIFAELNELSAATSTPRHYLPMDGGIGNIAEPTIRAFEGGMHATVNASHKPSLGEGWEEVLRLCGLMMPDKEIILPANASLLWADHESRSLAERADAFLKLTQGDRGLPWEIGAEVALNLSQDKIRQYQAQQSGNALTKVIEEALKPTEREPEPVAA